MRKIFWLIPLLVILTISCSPLQPPAEIEVIEEKPPLDVVIDPVNGEVDDIVDETVSLDLDKPFDPKEYKIEDAFPFLQFDEPLLLTNANDDTNMVYIVERKGKIKYLFNDSSTATTEVFLDLSDKIDANGSEKGLLGLAFHPDYKENGYFFVNYTDKDGTVIARYSRKIDKPSEGDRDSEEILLKFSQPYSNHNGGHIEFGPDGNLYISSGDGGSGGDPQNNAQNRSTYLGKLLRIDVNGTNGDNLYTIPEDNPYAANTEGYLEEIYSYGLRNPWKFSFDKERDILIAADVGQDKIEEINIIESGGNYGWNIMEGSLKYSSTSTVPEDIIPPIWEYDHSLGKSITGGYTYYAKENPSLNGVYIYGDFISGRIWGLWLDKEMNVQNHELIDTDLMISSFGLDSKGEKMKRQKRIGYRKAKVNIRVNQAKTKRGKSRKEK